MTDFRVQDISVKAGSAPLVSDASFSLSGGEFVIMVGPNGAGKTSLLRAALGLIKPSSGDSQIDSKPVTTLDPASRAQRVTYLPQTRPLAWPARVRDVVSLGRFAWGASAFKMSAEDRQAVEQALADCDLSHLAERPTNTLSGGELARVHCARAFASHAPLLIADEPVAALDPHHQLQIMDLIKAYVAKGGGALIVLHDLTLAARYATRLIWMDQGRIIADGPPAETLTAERMAEVYKVQANIKDGQVAITGRL